jgi:hypothetical protein
MPADYQQDPGTAGPFDAGLEGGITTPADTVADQYVSLGIWLLVQYFFQLNDASIGAPAVTPVPDND